MEVLFINNIDTDTEMLRWSELLEATHWNPLQLLQVDAQLVI